MVTALIRGAPIETILSNFICAGISNIQNALVIPSELNDILTTRLGDTRDRLSTNWQLFNFLATRANDDVFSNAIRNYPELFDRKCWLTQDINNFPKISVYARAHNLGLLPQKIRLIAIQLLTKAALNEYDLSFFDSDLILALLPSHELIKLGLKLRGSVLPSIGIRIDEIADEDLDLDQEPKSHFENILNLLEHLEKFDLDTNAVELIQNAREQIDYSIEIITDRKRDHDRHDEGDDYWESVATQKPTPNSIQRHDERSIFDDVDE